MNERHVDVVIVAYNAPEALACCLRGLDRQLAVTIVDNSSSREVAAAAAHHGATYVDAGENLGFAAGVNIGLARLTGRDTDVLLLNPDAVIGPGDVWALSRFLHSPPNARVSSVAPLLRSLDQGEQRVAWPFPTPARMWAEAIGLGRLPARRIFVVGAVLLLRREAIDEVGGFDERFFLYAEEADWQRRASAHGWYSAVCTSVVAQHAGAGTSTSDLRREALFHAAHETYIRKWYGPVGWWLYRTAACLGAAARFIILTDGRRVDAARRMLLYLRGPSHCVAQWPE